MTARQRPEEPHERNYPLRVPPCGVIGHVDGCTFVLDSATGHMRHSGTLRPFLPAWIAPASRAVGDHLRAFAAKYPDRFVYVDGKLTTRRP